MQLIMPQLILMGTFICGEEMSMDNLVLAIRKIAIFLWSSLSWVPLNLWPSAVPIHWSWRKAVTSMLRGKIIWRNAELVVRRLRHCLDSRVLLDLNLGLLSPWLAVMSLHWPWTTVERLLAVAVNRTASAGLERKYLVFSFNFSLLLINCIIFLFCFRYYYPQRSLLVRLEPQWCHNLITAKWISFSFSSFSAG